MEMPGANVSSATCVVGDRIVPVPGHPPSGSWEHGPDHVSVERPFALRRWCAALAGLTAAFAAYISLVPFNFALPAGPGVYDAFRQALEADVHSRSNFAGNALLFTPIGFFGGGALLASGSPVARRTAIAIALLLMSLGWSFAIEFLQVLVPGRTPSLADVVAQTLGLLAGLSAWLFLSRDIHRWADGQASERGAGALQLGLLLFTAGRTVAMLLPLDVTLDLGLLAGKYRSGLIVINPVRSTALSASGLPGLLADVALSIPVGVFASIVGMRSGRRRVGSALVLGCVFVGLIELGEVFVVSRSADVVDWIANAIGVAGGVWVSTRLLPDRSGAAMPAPAWMPIGTIAALVLFVAYNWSPFDFQVSGDVIRSRLPMMLGVPFHGYYENPELKAIGDLLIKIALGVPIGICGGWWIARSPAPVRRTAASAMAVAAVFFLTAVEAGQILLPGRYPDNTDIVLGFIGIIIGNWIARRGRDLRR
jgi:VanZ family protein